MNHFSLIQFNYNIFIYKPQFVHYFFPTNWRNATKKWHYESTGTKCRLTKPKEKYFYTNTQAYSIRSNEEKIKMTLILKEYKKAWIERKKAVIITWQMANYLLLFILHAECWIKCMLLSLIRHRSVYVKVQKIHGLNGSFLSYSEQISFNCNPLACNFSIGLCTLIRNEPKLGSV